MGAPPGAAVAQGDPSNPAIVLTPHDPPGWDRIYEGSFIEGVLVTQLNGDFPSPVLASVSVPLYSADRQRMVIPRGARVVGSASATVGQIKNGSPSCFTGSSSPMVDGCPLSFVG